MAADLRFYFDPVCPFAWMTSKWVRQVAAQRDYEVEWRFISLRILNEHVDYAAQFPPEYEAGHTAGLRLLRVAARARSMRGPEAVGPLYETLGGHIFESERGEWLAGEHRDTREFVEPILAEAGLPADLAEALDDEAATRRSGRRPPRPWASPARTSAHRSCTSSRRTGWRSSVRSSVGCRTTTTPSRCGTTSSPWPASRGSRS